MTALQDTLKLLGKSDALNQYKVGLEKESLRTLTNLNVSSKPHPSFLGAALYNPYFTLDFAKAQLEWTTPPLNSFSSVLKFLEEAQRWTLTHPSKESVPSYWPFSMPMKFDKNLPFADFGSSYEATQKLLYRKGLCQRYGNDIQTICGIHYNLSFHPELFKILYKKFKPQQTLEEFTTSRYFHACRNYLRYGWFITYLFGASPLSSNPLPITQSFKGCYRARKATSLRMSEYGYYSRIQEQMGVSYNSLKNYLRDINYYINKPRLSYTTKLYDKNGNKTMLSDSYLQTTSEHYTRIRPKSLDMKNIKGKVSIDKIDYLELRSLDLNPLDPIGIDEDTCNFLHLFLLTCMLQPSPNLNKEQNKSLTNKQNLVALHGRNTSKILCSKNKTSIATEALKICSLLEPVAQAMDKNKKNSPYSKVLAWAQKAIHNPDLTHSGSLVKELESKKDFSSFTKSLVKKQKEFFKTKKVPYPMQKKFEQARKESEEKLKRQESKDRALLRGYENLELSTQVLIRAAQKKGLSVTVIDESNSLIEISKAKHKVIVKQATIFDAESYLTYALMNDKHLSKIFLQKAGIETPAGATAQSLKEGSLAYEKLKSEPCVIKPIHTNYGIGIHFIDKGEIKSAKQALINCFKLDTHVAVEKLIEGKEYRFLVINGKVNSIIYRDPAHIIGDGELSIKALVEKKNQDPNYYRKPYLIKLTQYEKSYLEKQNFSFTTIPKKGEKVYLRKNSNISKGGDSIDVTDSIPKFFHKIAIQATASCKAKICGVDIIIPSLMGKKYSVLELNDNPAIFFHANPYQGVNRDPGGNILKLLGF